MDEETTHDTVSFAAERDDKYKKYTTDIIKAKVTAFGQNVMEYAVKEMGKSVVQVVVDGSRQGFVRKDIKEIAISTAEAVGRHAVGYVVKEICDYISQVVDEGHGKNLGKQRMKGKLENIGKNVVGAFVIGIGNTVGQVIADTDRCRSYDDFSKIYIGKQKENAVIRNAIGCAVKDIGDAVGEMINERASNIRTKQDDKQMPRKGAKASGLHVAGYLVNKISNAVSKVMTKNAEKSLGKEDIKDIAKETARAISHDAFQYVAMTAGKVVSQIICAGTDCCLNQSNIKEVVKETVKIIGEKATAGIVDEIENGIIKVVVTGVENSIGKQEIKEIAKETAEVFSRNAMGFVFEEVGKGVIELIFEGKRENHGQQGITDIATETIKAIGKNIVGNVIKESGNAICGVIIECARNGFNHQNIKRIAIGTAEAVGRNAVGCVVRQICDGIRGAIRNEDSYSFVKSVIVKKVKEIARAIGGNTLGTAARETGNSVSKVIAKGAGKGLNDCTITDIATNMLKYLGKTTFRYFVKVICKNIAKIAARKACSTLTKGRAAGGSGIFVKITTIVTEKLSSAICEVINTGVEKGLSADYIKTKAKETTIDICCSTFECVAEETLGVIIVQGVGKITRKAFAVQTSKKIVGESTVFAQEAGKAVGQHLMEDGTKKVVSEMIKEVGESAAKDISIKGTEQAASFGSTVTQVASKNLARSSQALKHTAKTAAIGGAVIEGGLYTYNMVKLWNDKAKSKQQKQVETWRLTGSAVGSTAGGTAGAVLGQIIIPVPVVGAAVGGLIGSIVSGYLGGKSFKAIGSNIHS